MRIAVFANEGEASCRYRALEPMDELRRRGHDVWVNGPPDVAAGRASSRSAGTSQRGRRR